MIVDISLNYLNEGNLMDKAILFGNIIEHCHYIKPREGIIDRIWEIIEDNASPHIKDVFQYYGEYLSPPEEMEKHLTTIVLEDFPSWQLDIILFKPSELLLENAPYEWAVYRNLINAYSKHKVFGNVFTYLKQMVDNYWLVPENAGGVGAYKTMMELKNKGEYYREYRKKVCAVFDRDTNTDAIYDHHKNNLFLYLSNKSHDKITEEDINKLDYPGYVWHMWWKRMIENYFPPERYEALGVDMKEARQSDNYDYYKFEGDKHNYSKQMMEIISNGMTLKDFEACCRKFIIYRDEYSEFCLLLLKIAKIV